MSSLSWLSSWASKVSLAESAKATHPVSTALDLLVSIATADVEIYSPGVLGILRLEDRTVGKGGFAVVERGRTIHNQLVAVKKGILPFPISLENTQGGFDKHLRKLCLELRILSHAPLKSHPNILDVIGICLSEDSGHPSLSLVLEYSAKGDLKSFLMQDGGGLSSATLVSLVRQVADGLEALHDAKVCHGDVKTRNVLVIQKEETLMMKISDFGESVVALANDTSLPVELGYGTRFYNAPELRTPFSRGTFSFTIDAALSTDVYSFGLLAWEVLQKGQPYFDRSWIRGCSLQSGIEDQMEAYLDGLPQGGLLQHALNYLTESSFQDDPGRRCTIHKLGMHLHARAEYVEVE
jgi:serine/threonine protein kinase